jgi:rRNA maturation endonuclease Nob1
MRIMVEHVAEIKDDARPGKARCGYCGKISTDLDACEYCGEENLLHIFQPTQANPLVM